MIWGAHILNQTCSELIGFGWLGATCTFSRLHVFRRNKGIGKFPHVPAGAGWILSKRMVGLVMLLIA